MNRQEPLNYRALKQAFKRWYGARHPDNPDGHKPLTKTLLWYWSIHQGTDSALSVFLKSPPLEGVPISDRILVLGTNVECGILAEIVARLQKQNQSVDIKGFLDRYHASEPIRKRNARLGAEKITTITREHSGQLVYCTSTDDFWYKFMGEEDFIDNPHKASKPKRMITTGYLREVDRHLGSSTFPVGARLEQIAEEWNVPVERIPSFCP